MTKSFCKKLKQREDKINWLLHSENSTLFAFYRFTGASNRSSSLERDDPDISNKLNRSCINTTYVKCIYNICYPCPSHFNYYIIRAENTKIIGKIGKRKNRKYVSSLRMCSEIFINTYKSQIVSDAVEINLKYMRDLILHLMNLSESLQNPSKNGNCLCAKKAY